MQNVLVTGGAGYIGSHACKTLATAGFRPITIDNLCLGHRDFVRWGPLIEVDIRNTDVVAHALRTHDVVGVLHFAAFAYVGESVSDPCKYYENNVLGTLSVLNAMRQQGLRKIVFSSSCAVYGSPSVDLITEDTPTQPVNPYGRSKLMCEEILTDYVAAYGIERVALRYFNAAGAEADAGIGEDREIETHLIPRAILSLQGRVPDFAVFGSDFPTPDGTAIRDYIHVSDLADAHVLALRYLLDERGSGCFNLGLEQGYSVKQVIETIEAVSGQRLGLPIGNRRPGDPARLVADTEAARRTLGFHPKYTSIRDIVQDAWRWHNAHRSFFATRAI